MKFDKKEIFSIPNIITYFRIICIPLFIGLSIASGATNNLGFAYGALAVFLIAAASDVIDGKIARHYKLVTKLGMMMDPVADKLMHLSILFCLAFAIKLNGVAFLHWGFVVAILSKELLQLALSGVSAKKGIVLPANAFGKIASATLSAGVILTFFHNYLYPWDWAVTAVAIAQSYYALLRYIIIAVKLMKERKQAIKEGKISEDEVIVGDTSID